MTKKKSTGRPAGAKTEKPPIATVPASRCGKCDSTDRERYYQVIEKAITGLDREGRPYTHVVWRYTRCTACRQRRIDRTYECRQEAGKGRRKAA